MSKEVNGIGAVITKAEIHPGDAFKITDEPKADHLVFYCNRQNQIQVKNLKQHSPMYAHMDKEATKFYASTETVVVTNRR